MTNRLKEQVINLTVAVFIFSLFWGCAATMPQVQQLTPIAIGPEGSKPIAFTRLIIRVPSGTEIGAHHDKLLKVSMFQYVWQSNITVASDEFKIFASEQLKSRGYRVLGGDNLLFGKDESAKAEYQLGGTVPSLLFNTYAPLAGNYSESTITIEWQLFDALREQVVFTATTNGYGKQSGKGTACILTAFRSALDNLLANTEFVNKVKKVPGKYGSQAVDNLSPIEIASCTSEQKLILPENLQTVLRSVLTLRAGGAVGSGVLISNEGWAITAGHLVSGLKEVTVRLQSGLELTATVVRVDSQQDIALIKLPGRGHPCVGVAAGKEPLIGTDLFIAGAPTGEDLALSITKGVVSGLREWQGKRYIQTDAALNPGNSGGPMFSSEGRVVGIVSWKIAEPGFEGLSFGVPVQVLKDRLRIIGE